ncbi:MAG TPA: hypothetical protein VGO52_23780 [Hyphomonadaceae bacterium]|nr:hypothetical protein [Hyphomonadaceae bacterium]
MAQSNTANAIPSSGRSETTDSSSPGRPHDDSGTPMSSYIGLGLAALMLVAMVVVGGMWR